MSESQNAPLNIPYPPGDIFEFKKDVVNPANQVMEQSNSTFVLSGLKYQSGTKKIMAGVIPDTETGDGIFAYFEGVPFPAKGHPFPQALYAINMTKKMFMNFARIISNKKAVVALIGFPFLPWKKKIAILETTIAAMNDTSRMILTPYYLEDGYYATLCKQIMIFLTEFLVSLGINRPDAYRFSKTIASFVQYDNAYYFRWGDMMGESSKEALYKNPRKELKRILMIANSRERKENDVQRAKNNTFANILSFALIFPRVKKAFRTALDAIDFDAWKLDEADEYHTLLWIDYNFRGKTIEERIAEYKEIHKNGLPRRITYEFAPNK